MNTLEDTFQNLYYTNVIVKRVLDEHKYNGVPLEDSLKVAVVALAKSQKTTEDSYLDLLMKMFWRSNEIPTPSNR